MHLKIVFFLAVIFLIQLSTAVDPKLQQCIDKAFDQAQKIKWTVPKQLPNCFDVSKLKDARKSIDVFSEFYNSQPEKCRRPNSKNVKECIDFITKSLQSKEKSLQAGLIGAIHHFFEASQNCFKNIVDVFDNFDQYVLNGCQ